MFPHVVDGFGGTQSMAEADDARRAAPSVARNRDPILAVLRSWLPVRGRVLEIASGTGEHVVHFARALPGLQFQPSDPDAGARASIDAWAREAGVRNVGPAIALDVRDGAWPIAAADAVIAINMIHIAPWAACEGLIAGAARVLAAAGETVWSHVGSADLTMRDFSPRFLADYLAQAGARVTDSVGAYQLEGLGVQLFERIDGDYFTILGLPLLPLLIELRERGHATH